MRIPKRYGQSREDTCPFCDKRAIAVNAQGLPTCTEHKNKFLEVTCLCGEPLEIRSGKWGSYGHCLNCGNVNLKKVL